MPDLSSQPLSAHAVVLAAGEGTRMRSHAPKVLHEVAHLPLIAHVLNAACGAGLASTSLVLGAGGAEVEVDLAARGYVFGVVEQSERLGTGHAVEMVSKAGQIPESPVMVLLGDAPLITPSSIRGALQKLEDGVDLVIVAFNAADPTGYGRLVMEDGAPVAIMEEKEATEEQKAITLCNSGLMAFGLGVLEPLLAKLSNDNSKGEYYLTDTISHARNAGLRVDYIIASEQELAGVNTRADLAEVEAAFQDRRRRELMLSGVTMQAPETVMLSHDTVLEPDVVLEPNIVFGPGVRVETGAVVRAFSHLEGTYIHAHAVVGPFARLRPGADIGVGAKVGNFCEVKKAVVGAGAKVNHLSYIGDASVGARANIGAGTITCNYDGASKHHTEIGVGAFIGSNSSIVAPVTVEDGAYVGSGSVITKDVPEGDLAIARGRQVNLAGRAPKTSKT
ncbi:MAG: bifunctional UDP-N-acetylglucosamine diphosphorylase/glucosamine-1-phosphate N-acetyltransferase GlmU [Pseudomonadota bacterium]